MNPGTLSLASKRPDDDLGDSIDERVSVSNYATMIAAPFAALYFSNFLNYAFLSFWSFRPSYFLVLPVVAAFPLLIGQRLRLDLQSPLVIWCLSYLLICCVWFIAFGATATQSFASRVFSIAFLLGSYALFCAAGEGLRYVRYGLLVCVLAGVLVNLYDISHPFALAQSPETALIGRAAGFYINPNQSGAALLLGFVLTIDIVRKRLRALYTLVVVLGVLVTASRAAIAGAVLIIGLLTLIGKLRARELFVLFSVFSIAVAAFTTIVGTNLGFQLDLGVLLERLAWFSDLGSSADFSQRERVMLAEKGWELVTESPMAGGGLGATEVWSLRSSTHNMYLALMADFGVLGAAVFPMLVLASVGGWRNAGSGEALPFACFLLFFGLFSHNVIGEYYVMISIALMAALARHRVRGPA